MKKFFTLSLLGLCLAHAALANPTLYPVKTSRISEIKNSTRSDIMADDVDENVFWVLPPTTGTSEVSSLHTLSTNLGFCREMRDAQNFSRSTLARIDALQERQFDLETEDKIKQSECENARQNLSRHIAINHALEMARLETHIEDLQVQIDGWVTKLSTCTQDCRAIRITIDGLKNEKRAESRRRQDLYSEHSVALRDYERKKDAVHQLELDLADLDTRRVRLTKNLLDLRATYFSIYEGYTRLEGARAAISFESQWDANVERLRAENPTFAFNKIITQNAVLTASIMNMKDFPAGSAIMSYELDGEKQDGKITLPAYPESFSGNIILSLAGACPMLHPEYFDINVSTGVNSMKYGMTVSYEFPSSFLVEATATYDMSKMYEKIVKSKSRGGFFSSRSWTSVRERTEFSDEFKVVWSTQDDALSVSDEQKKILEDEWRNLIFARLAAIALPYVANPGQLVTPPLNPTGAVVLSQAMGKNPACQGNMYCAGATIAIDVLNSIFMNTSATASYVNTQTANMVERWSRSEIKYKPRVTSYVSKKQGEVK